MPEPTTDERITVDACPKCGAREYDPPRDCEFCESGGHLVPVAYVPESVVDALREENERLREQREVLREWMRREFGVVIEGEGRNPDGVMQDAETMLLCVEEIEAERDALRARVEELGAGLRDLLTLIGDLRSEDYVAGWEADPPVNRARDLLFGGSQEPRPDTGWKLGVEAQRERDEKDARLGIRHRRPDTKETKT